LAFSFPFTALLLLLRLRFWNKFNGTVDAGAVVGTVKIFE
jgi:hypothetical protein